MAASVDSLGYDRAQHADRLVRRLVRERFAGAPLEREDLVQIGLLRVYEKAHGYSKRYRWATFVYAYAAGAILEALRKHRGRGNVKVAVVSLELVAEPGHEDSHRCHLLARNLRDAIDRLPEPQQDAVWLLALGATLEEAGQITGVHPACAGMRRSRARAKLIHDPVLRDYALDTGH